jgi:hypothetical protein
MTFVNTVTKVRVAREHRQWSTLQKDPVSSNYRTGHTAARETGRHVEQEVAVANSFDSQPTKNDGSVRLKGLNSLNRQDKAPLWQPFGK